MTLPLSTWEAIQELLNQDSTLAGKLSSASDKYQIISTLAAAAQAKGIIIDEAALSEMLDLMLDQSTRNQALADEQLESIAGGSENMNNTVDDPLAKWFLARQEYKLRGRGRY